MTSEGEARKTSEFLRRRKLRLQQVREQSKDIAKLIRQRAGVEKLKRVVELDAKKEKVFLQHQDKVVKKLEQLYSNGLQNVGTSHTDASGLSQPDLVIKTDLAQIRGREAAATLKRKKQEKLDEQRRSLERKAQAREAANVISREKSTTIANKLSTKSSTSKFSDEIKSGVKSVSVDKGDPIKLTDHCEQNKKIDKEVSVNDMATQWDSGILPNEWEPNIPALAIPKDDNIKENPTTDTENRKRPNLFALSDEMPSSLRGTHHIEKETFKPSLTLVSEYIQNRALRLREPEAPKCSKKQSEDLQTLKQTILRTRSTNHQAKMNNTERSFREGHSENGLTKKKSVTMYNHSTKDTRDVPFPDERVVVRDATAHEDAYSGALNETAASCDREKQNKNVQDMLHKIASTRQHVEKEYKETMDFLNDLPKNKGSKPINKAYKDDRRLQMQSENRQRTLQQEFRRVENESRKGMTCGAKSALQRNHPRKSSSISGDSFNERDFQYSWMPVPEGDGNLAVHTIPTAVKEGKTGNCVKFSKVDSYHEYRSRHKHTPPTKDTCSHDKKVKKRYVEAVIIQQKDDVSLSVSSISSDNDSIEDLRVDPKENKNTGNHDTIGELTDAERIIIYKILDLKNDKSSKKSKTVDMTQGSSDMENDERKRPSHHDNTATKLKQRKDNPRLTGTNNDNALPTDNLDEGLYKIEQPKGDNITMMYYADGPQEADDLVEGDHSKRHSSYKQNINNENQFAEGQCRSDACREYHRSRRKQCKKRDEPTTSENQTSNLHSPQIPSTTSFRTATNVKLDGTKAESGFAKLVDEGGKEKGNIYIGATGLLKDDAYEVVIQLRKKGAKNSISKENMTKSACLEPTEKNNSTSVESPDTIPMEPETVEQYSEVMDHLQSVPGRQDPVITTNKIIAETEVTDLAHNDMSTKHSKGSSRNLSSSNIAKHDESVFTPRDATDTIMNEVPETQAVPKTMVAATSTSTQTTHASPNPKPVFIHMSSSTSTAYMSPPEVIFPKYFRRGYESSDDAYQHFDRLDGKHIINQQRPYCEKYEYKCKCRRCLGHHRAYLKKEQKVEENRLKTPPNTARSVDTAIGDDSFNFDRMKKTSTHSSPMSTHRYHKCKFKVNSKSSCKYHKNQSPALPKRNNKISVLYNRKGKVSSNTSKSTSHSYLNPMIKDYINKLLSLNREGLKAIQVMNQECSSVNTPADSILNIPGNFHNDNTDCNALRTKISLEQLKNFIRKQIFEDYAIPHYFGEDAKSRDLKSCNFVPKRVKTLRQKLKKKKNGHKVKNLNISKNIRSNTCPKINESSTSIVKRNRVDSETKSRSQSSSERIETPEEIMSSKTDKINILNAQNKHHTIKVLHARKSRSQYHCDDTSCDKPKTVTSSGSTSPDGYIISALKKKSTNQPINSATQTSRSIDNEMNFMKLAEDKLQNMEKIASLTEKCTKRLSNLAKVLEEVRKNKSLAYSQISNSDSTDCDQKSEKAGITDKIEKDSYNSAFQGKSEIKSPPTASSKESNSLDPTDYEALLFDIPKDGYVEMPHSDDDMNDANSKTSTLGTTNTDYRINNTKCRSKPPPALSRIHLKRTQENVIPHELSTVIEVDSPMSVKLKNQSSNVDSSNQAKNLVEERKDEDIRINGSRKEYVNTVSRQGTANNNDALKVVSIDSSDDSKLRMMDLNQFNEIMLRPFISLQEYAQEYYGDGVSAKQETIARDRRALEDVSSLNSDGSLPDVVAELLKRKLITEPFKFDSASNVNSTTVSSESTFSVLALSRTRKDKGKLKTVENKENVTETSDTLSISSNPDLENAFKKLGMGWASSTLKKTKERLALSSSSNTSSSSLSQFKFKYSSKQDMPTIVTDSVSSVPNLQLKTAPERYTDISKNVEQQTSLTNSMTVKEFLTKELAKKITFTKSDRYETNEEFVSLIETKMPDELKNSSHTMIENNAADNVPIGNNRARTSTPVQIFKSVTYHSSSSSNISNGLFSNADDLSSVKMTSTSVKNHSTSEKDELTVPNYSLKMRKGLSDCSKTDSY